MANIPALVLKNARNRVPVVNAGLNFVEARFDQLKMNQGRILIRLNRQLTSRKLQDYEFKVFSQWGEDGIIQKLIDSVEIREKTFIEFGVEHFSESNCRFLMMHDNWSGFVMDGSELNIEACKRSHYYFKYELEARQAFITRDNINELLSHSGFGPDLGILSIDLDGVDYWVAQAITGFTPRILIHEYNALLGTRKITVPYDPAFERQKKHYSCLYWGASLGAVTHLANQRGYTLVGTNSACCNAFFVRNDLMTDKLEALTVEQAYSPSKYREAKDEQGRLTFASGDARLRALAGLPVFNVETGLEETL